MADSRPSGGSKGTFQRTTSYAPDATWTGWRPAWIASRSLQWPAAGIALRSADERAEMHQPDHSAENDLTTGWKRPEFPSPSAYPHEGWRPCRCALRTFLAVSFGPYSIHRILGGPWSTWQCWQRLV